MKKNYTGIFVALLCLFLVQTTIAQSKLVDSEYGAIIYDYLKSSTASSKLTTSDLEDIYVNKELLSEKTGVVNVYLNQRYKGVKIFNAISSVGIKKEKVFHFANKFESNISEKINTQKSAISPLEAVSKLASYFNLGSVGNLEVIEETNNKVLFSKGNVSQENISVEKVYFKDKDGTLKLSWNLNILTIDGKHWWSARLDANTGQILDLSDWILTCNFGDTDHKNHKHNKSIEKSFNLFKTNATAMVDGSQYNVFALPIESPNHGPRTLVTEPADEIASPFGWHDDDGISGADYTTTQGNNVIAQDDSDGNNGTGYQPDGGATLNFDYTLDLDGQPSASQDASITNLFYMNNMIHDITYQYGFDMRSGGFQEKHYQRVNAAGVGDPVLADGLDGSGINNANFGTPPDGISPRMQMFLWEKVTGSALTINNGSLAGNYIGIPAGFGGALTETPLTAELALAIDDDAGESTDPNDACDALTNASQLVGKIAIINRGLCEFGDKLLAVENAGAVGAIVITDDRPIGVMGEGANGSSVTIPGIMISREDGDAIIAALNDAETISASLTLPPFIDGNYDNGVIVHEYGHGISNRLTGGASDTDCLGNVEQMGEGWSDWFALMLTLKASDFGGSGRGIATFDSDQPIDGVGIRPAKYSADFGINNFTYNATNDNTILGQNADGEDVRWNEIVHNIGFVWATVLWDLSSAYVDKYGFDPNMYTGTGGNNKVMQIVMDGLKLQPCSPGMVEGRDAILAADIALTGGEDQCMIWEVFARRGLGVNASQGTTESIDDQIEDFDTPDSTDPSLANCTTLSSTEFNSKDFRIYPNPASNKLMIKASKAMGDVVIDIIDVNGRKVLTKSTTLLGEVELNTSTLQSGLYILKIKGEFINTNEKILIE